MRLDNPRLIMKQSTIQLFFSADHKSWNLRPNHISKPTANTPVPKTPHAKALPNWQDSNDVLTRLYHLY